MHQNKYFFNPYIGKLYHTGLINNKKILVLGASHYCLYNTSSETFKCPVWEQCTSDESKDSSQFDLCCPYYQSIGWYNQYDYIKLSNSPRIELENYLSDGGYDTYDNFSQCLKDILKMPSVQYIWERLAFVNYVQYFLPTQTTPTLNKNDIGYFESFLEYIDNLKPDVIIVWGTQVTNHFKHAYIQRKVKRLEIRKNTYFWDFENNSHRCVIVNSYHPCDTPPWYQWSKNIDGFKSALTEALGIKTED